MKKQIYLLASFLFVSLVINAQKKQLGQNVYGEINSNGVLVISGHGEIDKFVEIKFEGLRGEGVRGETIPDTPIKEVIIENGITSIGELAFYECKVLEKILLPNTVTSIGDKAFYACTRLKSIIFPNSLTSIGNQAFFYCTHLTSVTIPKSVTSIRWDAFCGCSNLSTVTLESNAIVSTQRLHSLFGKQVKEYVIGEGVTSIRERTFSDCTDLTSITIPNSVTSIGESAFYKCKSLNNISIPNSVTSIGKAAFFGTGTDGYYYDRNIESLPLWLTEGGKQAWSHYYLSENSVRAYMQKKGIDYSTFAWKDDYYYPLRKITNGTTTYYAVNRNGRYGLTDAKGKVIVPTEMEALESAGTGYLRYKLNGFWGVMNYAGKIIIDTDRGYTSIGDFKTFNKRFPYTMTGYKGECDINGRPVSKIKVETPPQQKVIVRQEETPQKKEEKVEVVVKQQRFVPCVGCGGTGLCAHCVGGMQQNPYNGEWSICIICGGRKACTICGGRKGDYVYD